MVVELECLNDRSLRAGSFLRSRARVAEPRKSFTALSQSSSGSVPLSRDPKRGYYEPYRAWLPHRLSSCRREGRNQRIGENEYKHGELGDEREAQPGTLGNERQGRAGINRDDAALELRQLGLGFLVSFTMPD